MSKPSKKNLTLATKIIKQHGNVHKDGEYWVSNMDALIGMSLGCPVEKVEPAESADPDYNANTKQITKAEAIDNIAEQLAGELDSGALDLADDWEKNNLR